LDAFDRNPWMTSFGIAGCFRPESVDDLPRNTQSRRFFLYGGAKEFNVEWDEVDRVVDYMIALEAALVPEHLFVGRCLRERAARLIGQDDQPTKRFLRDLYNIRSTIAHGSPLSARDKEFLNANRLRVEEVVRQILVAALRLIPASEQDRKMFLGNLYA